MEKEEELWYPVHGLLDVPLELRILAVEDHTPAMLPSTLRDRKDQLFYFYELGLYHGTKPLVCPFFSLPADNPVWARSVPVDSALCFDNNHLPWLYFSVTCAHYTIFQPLF